MTATDDASDTEPGCIVDLWRVAEAGPDATEQVLRLGVSRLDEVAALLDLGDAETREFDRGDGHRVYIRDAVFCQFDPEGRLSGLGYGDYVSGRHVDAAVETAVARLNGFGDKVGDLDLELGPDVGLRYRGYRISHFATLPRFISVSKDIQGFELSAWPEDKTVSLARTTPHGALYASFALKAFKTEYTEHFQIDYCLNWFAAFTAQSLADVAGSPAVPQP